MINKKKKNIQLAGALRKFNSVFNDWKNTVLFF